MVTDTAEQEIVAEPGGLLEDLRPGTVIVEMSTIDPAVGASLAAGVAPGGSCWTRPSPGASPPSRRASSPSWSEVTRPLTSAGDVIFTPAGDWHGFDNTSDEDVELIWGWAGAGSLEAASYEVDAWHLDVATGGYGWRRRSAASSTASMMAL